jgi:antitoxin component YwqK of YwqJK toxin-antitoxin module
MKLKRIAGALALLAAATACHEIAEQAAKEINESIAASDSLADLRPDDLTEDRNYYSDSIRVLERKKAGKDSLYRVASYYAQGAKASEIWYRNNKREGVAVFFHPDGKLFCKLIYKDGGEHTISEGYDSKGKPLNCGNLKDGNGTLLYYDPVTDHLVSNVAYVNGKKEGDFFLYYQSGELYKKGVYKANELNGPVRAYYKNGKVWQQGTFVNSKIDGDFIIYYRSGRVKFEQQWVNGTLLAAKQFDVRGNIIAEATMTGKEQYHEKRYDYDELGRIRSKSAYTNELKDGNFEYYSEGRVHRSELWKRDTLFKEQEWYSSGAAKSVTFYKNNQRDSIYSQYYPTGALRLQQGYKDGEKHGIYISYYDNGQVFVQGAYANGKPFGRFRHYTKEGKYKGSYTPKEE